MSVVFEAAGTAGLPFADIRVQERSLMSQQDLMLMHRVAAGDEEATAELYDRFSSLVYKVACQLLPSRTEAEDAVQGRSRRRSDKPREPVPARPCVLHSDPRCRKVGR